ncbi:MAG: hypothetical protein HY865_01350 [Chloroflexi bacterium]|nr:hypothetical protein [Chloroflexota bacterium]
MTAKPSRYFWIILLALLTACGQVSPEATPTATLTLLPPTVTSVPTITSTPEPQQPPACTFPLAETTTEESKLEEYTFSEPQVVLTAEKNNFYYIAQWLPDNQRVLISEELRNGLEYGKAVPESIELFNSETGNTEVYASRPSLTSPHCGCRS